MGAEGQTYGGRVETLARLRVLVSYLGEKDQFNWWATAFLSPTGRRFLEYNFPRTVLSAGAQSASAAAKRIHDERIGRAAVYHLFRLPHALEQDIHRHLTGAAGPGLAALVSGRELALDALKAVAEGETMLARGPVRVSSLAQMTHRPSIRKLAACYYEAFRTEAQAFPYFTDDSG